MRDKQLCEVLAAIWRCLQAISARKSLCTEEFDRDMQEIRNAVEGMGGGVD